MIWLIALVSLIAVGVVLGIVAAFARAAWECDEDGRASDMDARGGRS